MATKAAAKKKVRKARLSYPALLLVQNKRRFYFATIPVDDLFPCCFVARRDEDAIAGFQRSLNENRANDIAEYLAAGSGSIPSNIVLSAQDDAAFQYNRRTKSISFDRGTGVFLVLDGQHRLWGYQKSSVRHRVPVAIYDGLTRAEETKLFIDINTTQRGVPAALLLDIKSLADEENATDSTLRSIFDKLNEDSHSPMVGLLSPSKSVVGKISRVTFNRSLEPIIKGPVMAGNSSATRYRLIRNYLNAFDAELQNKKLLTTASFFEAIFEIFNNVIEECVERSGDAKQSTIQQYIQPVARLDYRGSGGKAILDKKGIVSLMQSALRTKTTISDSML